MIVIRRTTFRTLLFEKSNAGRHRGKVPDIGTFTFAAAQRVRLALAVGKRHGSGWQGTPQSRRTHALKEKIRVAVPKNFLKGIRSDVALDELADLTYVTSENMSARAFYSRIDILADQAGIIRRLELPRHEMWTIMNFVVSGTAFALCPVNEQSPANRFFSDQLVDVLPLRRADIFTTTYVGWNIDDLETDPTIKEIVADVQRTYRTPLQL